MQPIDILTYLLLPVCLLPHCMQRMFHQRGYMAADVEGQGWDRTVRVGFYVRERRHLLFIEIASSKTINGMESASIWMVGVCIKATNIYCVKYVSF